jgi:peroxidase
MSFQLTNHLFEEEGKGFGMDLMALDTQRTRDHGITTFCKVDAINLSHFVDDYTGTAGYNSYRTLCGYGRAKDFDDLLDLIPAKVRPQIEKALNLKKK